MLPIQRNLLSLYRGRGYSPLYSLQRRIVREPRSFSSVMSPQTNLETYVLKGGIKVTERFFTVPLNYSKPDGESITVFARNLAPLKRTDKEDDSDLPYMVYLQGGPGFEVEIDAIRSFADKIHEKGYQTLWLDQRGTGLSTPISSEFLEGKTDQEKADYLKHFRADNIVRDCEHIRKELLSDKENPEDRKWSILGQSFGGFCALTYLSFFPDGLKEAFLTGGLAPISTAEPDPVYERTLKRVVQRNEIYYRKYPQDVNRVRKILSYLDNNEIDLPNGGRLSPSRWLQLGINFGMQGGIDAVHQLVLRAAIELDSHGKLSYKLLQKVQSQGAYDGNPIYAILHEPCYCQGRASNWSADRLISSDKRFSWPLAKSASADEPVYFFGEMIFADMFDDYANLQPLKGAAQILAEYDGWEKLYDEAQLAKNEVKVTAASYVDDMYVDYNLAQETASKVNGIEQFITNQMFHDGLRKHSSEVIDKLFSIHKREYD